jgi:D-glycero-alpha-D-manno-heptose 1-phosphate guanylyltransferase
MADRWLGAVEAVILAGGPGTRLRGVVPDVPKALAPVAGRPFLGYLVDWLAGWGVRRLVLAVGHGARQIRDYVLAEKSFGAMEMVFSEESTPLGTGGALGLATRYLGSDCALVLNGDTFLALPLDGFRDFHRAEAADVTIAAVQVPDATPFGALEFDAGRRVTAFREKAAAGGAPYINGGVYLVSSRLARSISVRCQSLERDLLPAWLSTHRVLAFPGDFPFVDIGTPQRYQAAQRIIPLCVREAMPRPGGPATT